MTTPTSIIASVPVTIPSPPPSAMQEGVASFIFFTPDMAPLTVGVVMAGQLDMMVMVLVGIIWEHISVCTTVVSDVSLTRTVVGTVAMDTTVVVSVVVTVSVTVVGDDGVIGHVQSPVYITY